MEFIGLYLALPVALWGARLLYGPFPVLPALWVAAVPAAVYLVARRGWGVRELFGVALSGRQARLLAARAVTAAAVLAFGILLDAPERFLELPRNRPGLWALVMVCYPVLSVLPQGLLYRGLYEARYACLFRSGAAQWAAGAAAFALAHLVFANVWAVALTFLGGLAINRTYRQTGSLMASDLEHALYGQLVFTLGWGRFLYHGTVRLLESLAG